ncbi:hypothetical protein E8E13_004935 [Curvularia kusanoi]|uniref:Uncharacterized protein n=1 Tax=Curvularia kusanoi TaxID=90978 RepID=A0A9P4TIR1_CURKU|nr:hypothetical protein E8E13_004935 [Curvularia kusanoi]
MAQPVPAPNHPVPHVEYLYPEVTPELTVRELHRQPMVLFAHNPVSGCPINPEETLVTGRDEATDRARRIAVHTISVDRVHYHELMGTANSESTKLDENMFGDVRSAVSGEMFGKSSFLTKHVFGRYSSYRLKTLIHNLRIWSRIYEFAVPGETWDQVLLRLSNSAFCTAEAVRLENLWTTKYNEHIRDQGNLVEVLTGEANAQAQRQLGFLRRIVNEPPRCTIPNVAALPTRQAAFQALMRPDSDMTKDEHFFASVVHQSTMPKISVSPTRSKITSFFKRVSRADAETPPTPSSISKRNNTSPKQQQTPLQEPQRAFADPPIFICLQPTCGHDTGEFESYRGLVRHVDIFHKIEKTATCTESPLEDGTRKIP